ncbi:MAG: DUF433 domain-containing protein [Nodularia sp. (in: cyanobacteria)]|nr:DUF433 domain-containing protein [Nodularia sp. (in: cyanobacteria)]
MDDTLLTRITLNPHICHGKPCIRGLRYPVEFILEMLSSGMTNDEILADYDDLESEDILALLGEDAQEWVSQSRREADKHREGLLRNTIENFGGR